MIKAMDKIELYIIQSDGNKKKYLKRGERGEYRMKEIILSSHYDTIWGAIHVTRPATFREVK